MIINKFILEIEFKFTQFSLGETHFLSFVNLSYNVLFKQGKCTRLIIHVMVYLSYTMQIIPYISSHVFVALYIIDEYYILIFTIYQ